MPESTEPKFKKGQIVFRSHGDDTEPTKHKIIAGPVKAGNADKCYVLEGQPGLVLSHVLSVVPTEDNENPLQEREVLGVVNETPAASEQAPA